MRHPIAAILLVIAAALASRDLHADPPYSATSSRAHSLPSVCRIVADAWTAGKGSTIAKSEGRVTIGGVSYSFAPDASNQCIAGLTVAPSVDHGDDPLPGVPANDPSAIDIVAASGRDYVVFRDALGPYEVYEPNKGLVCTLPRRFQPVLTESHASVCNAFLADETDPSPAFTAWSTPVPLPRESEALSGNFTYNADGVFLNAGALVQAGETLAHVINDGQFPCGGEGPVGRAALLEHGREGTSEAAQSLRELTNSLPFPNGRGETFVVHYGGSDYLRVTSGAYEQDGHRSRLLVARDGARFKTVCRVDQKAIYTPALSAR